MRGVGVSAWRWSGIGTRLERGRDREKTEERLRNKKLKRMLLEKQQGWKLPMSQQRGTSPLLPFDPPTSERGARIHAQIPRVRFFQITSFFSYPTKLPSLLWFSSISVETENSFIISNFGDVVKQNMLLINVLKIIY